jgi:hypothetical protein
MIYLNLAWALSTSKRKGSSCRLLQKGKKNIYLRCRKTTASIAGLVKFGSQRWNFEELLNKILRHSSDSKSLVVQRKCLQ